MSDDDAESGSAMRDLFPLGEDEEDEDGVDQRATGTPDDELPHPWWHRAAPVGDDVAEGSAEERKGGRAEGL